ncbi:semaphorin-5A-like [Ptychodera flava]|uniref:semaphorin-5A-like n=1 Tax=Ptychodera flava TaxID=63121 RepID=UPI00396A8CF0
MELRVFLLACLILGIPAYICAQVLTIAPTTLCDVIKEPRVCVMSRDVGDDAKFDVDIEGEFNHDELQWYKHYLQGKNNSPRHDWRKHAPNKRRQKPDHISIKEDDFYENKYWIEISEDQLPFQKNIRAYQLDDDEVRYPSKNRVYFIVQCRPVDLGPYLVGDNLHIDLEDHYTIPASAMKYIWTKSVSPLEFKVLEDVDGTTMDSHSMQLTDFGVVSVRIYGSKEGIPGRVQIAERNFNIQLDHSRVCTQNGPRKVCQCTVGYQGNGNICKDMNECENGQAQCLPEAVCENTEGSYECICPDGYQGDGEKECTDMDECELNIHNCDTYASCMNTEGSYKCDCQEGYFGNGFDCIEMSIWTPWSPWSPCSVTCGSGTMSRSRTCTNPESGMICDGVAMEHETCTSSSPCPINGGWSEWSQWSPCSETCGGQRHQVRVCDNPTPLHGGLYCEGDLYKSEQCGDQSCPVDGNWSKWGDWSTCSATCGPSERSRVRLCDNPAPSEDGEPCTGLHKETKPCEDNPPCFGNRGWSSWSHWGTCTVTCGIGEQFRQRLCKDSKCSGQNQQQKPCFIRNCPRGYR